MTNLCPYCNEPMVNPRRVQCGATECKRRWQADRLRAYMRKRRLTDPQYGNRGRKPQGWTPARKAAYQKRRALKRATTAERIVAAEIYERDAWTCGLCSTHVDPLLVYPDPNSASLDHITPLSKGGTHTPDNVQLAHLRCNLAKNNRVSAAA